MTKLQAHHICQQANVIETKEFSSDQFFFKIRADFTGGNNFQARIYYNQGKGFEIAAQKIWLPPLTQLFTKTTP
jgi:hypothetical protein